MKSPLKISILVWICNILLVLMTVLIIAGTIYYFKMPGIINSISQFESALNQVPQANGTHSITRGANRFTQNFLADNFTMERTIDREAGIDDVKYYFASVKNLYLISFSDSLNLGANKINRELSSNESSLLGFKQKSITVTQPAGNVPVRFAAPAISLEKDNFITHARSNVLYMLLSLLFGIVFFWFLRKFVAGLRDPFFFTHKNAFYLKVTAWLAIAAPFLLWIWNNYLRPNYFTDYQFTRATEVSSGFSLPAVMLLLGLVLLIIAWCFDQGVKLQKEQELII